MYLSEQETALLQHLVLGSGKILKYSEAKSMLREWRKHCWTKAELRKSIRKLAEKRFVKHSRFEDLSVTESGIAAVKSV